MCSPKMNGPNTLGARGHASSGTGLWLRYLAPPYLLPTSVRRRIYETEKGAVKALGVFGQTHRGL